MGDNAKAESRCAEQGFICVSVLSFHLPFVPFFMETLLFLVHPSAIYTASPPPHRPPSSLPIFDRDLNWPHLLPPLLLLFLSVPLFCLFHPPPCVLLVKVILVWQTGGRGWCSYMQLLLWITDRWMIWAAAWKQSKTEGEGDSISCDLCLHPDEDTTCVHACHPRKCMPLFAPQRAAFIDFHYWSITMVTPLN